MTATNINIDQFIQVLVELRARGHKLVDLDFLPDEQSPGSNKIVIHPVIFQGYTGERQYPHQENSYPQTRTIIRNPNIDPEGDEIFNLFDL